VKKENSQREALTPEGIVTEALRLIDATGLEEFSTRKLGAALGIEAMSLYHHFPGKGALLDAVADRILAEVMVPDEPADDPINRLRQAALSYRAVARAHPRAFLLIAARRFNTPHALALLEKLLSLLQEAGLSPERAARWFRMEGYFLNGALLSEMTILAQMPDPTGSRVDAGELSSTHPAIVKSAPYLGAAYLDVTFDEGLEIILAALTRELNLKRT